MKLSPISFCQDDRHEAVPHADPVPFEQIGLEGFSSHRARRRDGVYDLTGHADHEDLQKRDGRGMDCQGRTPPHAVKEVHGRRGHEHEDHSPETHGGGAVVNPQGPDLVQEIQ